MIDELRRTLIRDEGMRLKPYKDTVGKLSIGVGRNLDDNGISESEAHHLLDNDIRVCVAEAQTLPGFYKLNGARQGVLCNMVFNLGLPKILRFQKMLSAVARQDFETAANEMLDSLWARQVGPRAYRLSQQMRTGEWVE